MKLNQKDNPLAISVYKLGAKDGNGAWFARRSTHEGLDFAKWQRGLESEFPETMKVRGGPGEGNIRGIGGERRVACQRVHGAGKLEGKPIYQSEKSCANNFQCIYYQLNFQAQQPQEILSR